MKGVESLIPPESRCCNWDHVRPCGPVPGVTDDSDDPICACGCTGYDQRCGTYSSDHPDDRGVPAGVVENQTIADEMRQAASTVDTHEWAREALLYGADEIDRVKARINDIAAENAVLRAKRPFYIEDGWQLHRQWDVPRGWVWRWHASEVRQVGAISDGALRSRAWCECRPPEGQA